MHGTYDNFAVERIVYGRPAAEVLAAEAARIGARRVFMLVSRTLDRETDWVDALRTALGDRYAGSCDGMPPHTPRDAVLDATAAARNAGADLIVSFGGGSLTDAAKMVRLALQHDIHSIEDFDRFVVRVQPDGSRLMPNYAAPEIGQIAIPTTLSGGDFNPSAGCTDPRTMLKEIFRHPKLMPRVIVLDPAVTLRTPTWLWLSTGIRALDHAVETICADTADPRSWLESLHAVRLLHSALPRTKADPGDQPARLDAQLAVCRRRSTIASAYRWARATGSAMCWAAPATCRTATRHASCCRRCCAGTNRRMRRGRSWWRRRWARRTVRPGRCWMSSSPASACRARWPRWA